MHWTILFKMTRYGAISIALFLFENVCSWNPQDVALNTFARKHVSTRSGQNPSTIVPTSSLFSVYSVLSTSREDEAVQATQQIIGDMADREGCIYTGWTKLGPRIFLHNVFSSGIAAKAHLEKLRPELMHLQRVGHVALEKISLHGNAAELLRVKNISTSISHDGISPATLMFRPENSILFQNPEEIHGPPINIYPYPEVSLNEESEFVIEINEGLHKKAKFTADQSEDSKTLDDMITPGAAMEDVNVTTYFEILDWVSARKNLAELIEASVDEETCKFQSWSRSRDLLVVHESFGAASDVASHWARSGVLYEAMFVAKAAFLNRVEVHSADAEAVEDLADQSGLLNFARFDRLESEIVGAVFARRVESEFAAAHRLLLYRMVDAERDYEHLHADDDDTNPRNAPEFVPSPIPSSPWATRGHRVHPGRINPVE